MRRKALSFLVASMAAVMMFAIPASAGTIEDHHHHHHHHRHGGDDGPHHR